MNPLLSVVMPTYNGDQFIAIALESVRQQLDKDIELIVVDDGSSDRTLEIVGEYAKKLPLRLITPGRIGNWVAVSNLGMREARGEWVCFLQQDDYWLPGRVARIRREMDTFEGALILHNAMFVGPDGQELGRWSCPLSEGSVPSDQCVERLLIQNFIAVPSPTFRRRAAVESGGMDDSLWVCADWDLWLRLAKMSPVSFVSETLTAFRLHPMSQAAVRKSQPDEWGRQLSIVLARHLRDGTLATQKTAAVERVAKVSIAVSGVLFAASRGEPIKASPVLAELIALGPAGWRRFFRDSRIVERVWPRLKLQYLS